MEYQKKNFRHNVQRKSMEMLNGNEQITFVTYNSVTRILHKSIAHCTHYIWHASHIARNTRDTYHTLHVSHSTLSTRGYRLTTFNSLALGIHVRRVARPVLSPTLPPSAFYAGYTFNEICLRFLFFWNIDCKLRVCVILRMFTGNNEEAAFGASRNEWTCGR